MSKRLYIIGTGGFSKDTAQLADSVNRATSQWDEIVYLAADAASVGSPMPYGRVIGTDAMLATMNEYVDVVIGVGVPAVRERIATQMRRFSHLRFPNLVHPKAEFDAQHVQLGVGNLITAGCVFSCDIVVRDFNVFNLSATVGHDAVIGSFNVFNPGCNLSGNVNIADSCLFGTGSQAIEKLSIASNTTLGAGAVLVKSVLVEGQVLTGVPAKPRIQ